MFKCKFIDFLFSVLPIKRWQDFLVRRHLQNCTVCQRRLVNSEDARRLFVPENRIEDLEGIWPAIKLRQAKEKEEKLPAQRRRRWAFATAFLLVIVVSAVWLYLAIGPGKERPEQSSIEQFQINSIEIDNEPAQAFVYHPRDSKTYFVWVEKKT